MKNTSFYTCIIAMTIALLCHTPVSARTISERRVESGTNPDGSALRIVTTTNEKAESRHVKVYYRSHPDLQMQLIWKKDFSLSESPSSGITLIDDWNQDGINDVSVTLSCGAGPPLTRSRSPMVRMRPSMKAHREPDAGGLSEPGLDLPFSRIWPDALNAPSATNRRKPRKLS